MKTLDPDLLLRAYSIGVFPMSDGRDAPGSLLGRAAAPGDHPAGRLPPLPLAAQDAAIGRCSRSRATPPSPRSSGSAPSGEDTWINAEIEASYIRLHEAGRAHSIEVWREGALAGGLYGVRLGAAFFGELMVSLERDASKVALAWLVARLIVGGFQLLDCQFMTPHLESRSARSRSTRRTIWRCWRRRSARAAGRGRRPAAASAAGPVEFEALDRLLAAPAARRAPACRPPDGSSRSSWARRRKSGARRR